jgi:GTP-binding protein
MAFVDELTFDAAAGKGGDGVVRWLHEKGKEYSGPSGGNGGNGGNIYMRAVRDLNLLARYRGEKRFDAPSGNDGENSNMHGKGGDDKIIDLPIGSLVRNKATGEMYELLEEGEKIIILKGGRGGAGNAAFKSSVNITPEQSTDGALGESATFTVELRIIADAGLVGLPNAGKSSLLNALTGAAAKVAPYAFTTLDPNLGALYGYIIADIPGLIEGASMGKGLGSRFLRHIARTRLTVHCLGLDSEDIWADYATVRKELDSFENGALAGKPEILVFTKSDTRDADYIKEKVAEATARGSKAFVVSILDDAQVEDMRKTLVAQLRVTQ